MYSPPQVIVVFVFTAWLALILAVISFYYEVVEPIVYSRRSRKTQQLTNSSGKKHDRDYIAQIRLKVDHLIDVLFRPLDPTIVPEEGTSSEVPLQNKVRGFKRWRLEPNTQHTRNPRIRKATNKMSKLLIDLQIVTCLAILIAGTSQLGTMSFYHQALVGDYWALTLNSLWAARKSTGRHFDTIELSLETAQEAIRSLLVITFLTLAAVFSIKTNLAFDKDWEILSSGKCFRFESDSPISPWFWTAGLLINLPLYVLSLGSRSWAVVRFFGKQLKRLRTWMDRTYEVTFEGIDGLLRELELSPLAWIISKFQKGSRAGIHFFRWIIVQLLAIFISGVGDFRVQALALLAFYCWTTADIIDLKLHNKSLIEGTESRWTFGQVLAVAMTSMLALNLVDSFVDERHVPIVANQGITDLELATKSPV